MNIRNFFKLQRCFKGKCVIDISPDEEHITPVEKLRCKELNLLNVREHEFKLIGYSFKAFDFMRDLLFGHLALSLRNAQHQKMDKHKLRAVRLCCGNSYLWSCKCVKYIISLSCYRTSDHIYYAKRFKSLILCKS